MLPGDPGELTKAVPVGRLGKAADVADLALAMLRNGYLDQQGRDAGRRDPPEVMELRGLEPLTYALPARRSSS